MDNHAVILLGGFYNIGFALFHMMFWKIFGWKTELSKLRRMNRSVVQVLNLCLTFCFIFFGCISIFQAEEMIASGLGRTFLLFISLFWLVRAVEQIVFFDFKNPTSIAMTILFLLGSCLYAYPLVFVS